MFNLFKSNKPSKETKPSIQYEYYYFEFKNENDKAISKYSKMKDELDLNDDYDMSKKELLEEFDSKVYRYLPTEFNAYLKDNNIYDEDDFLIGSIKEKDKNKLIDYIKLEIVFYHGKHKYIDFDDEEIYIEKGFSYFKYRIKKEVH